MLRKMLMGALLLIALAASPAAAQYDTVGVSPGTVTPGGTVTLTGQACLPNVEVTILLVPGAAKTKSTKVTTVPPEGVQVATTMADANGYFSVTFKVPADLAPGTYHFEVTAPHPDQFPANCFASVESANIVVAPPGTTVPTGTGGGTGGGGGLVHTGSNLDRMGLIGAGLLVTGGLLLVATKRRRHDVEPAPAI
jgi:hypothetical protein